MEERRRRLRQVALCAMLSAVTLTLLLIASFLPSGRMGLSAVSGLAVAVAVCAVGYGGGLSCYVVSGVLGLLLLPSKEVAVYYCLCFGVYPVVKAWIEARKNLVLEWVMKLAVGNVLMLAVYWVLQKLLQITLTFRGVGSWALLAVGNVVFVCYDIAFSQIMTYVQQRLLPVLRRAKFV
ncbi:MAG: hypothetical protein LUE89_12060 [Clostridiales bacterium]|nr:hypothetical protein [Clostridiales bacterium]